ncbi:MAG TPA: sugar phosphate isomerase/epimerase [Beijerinckiaceae bacterium]|nr:sugar phosphate isomerase/epimerase [Beijerinckiaceae bacterium]
MNTISLAALTILDAGPAGQIRAAAEAGFDAVGLRLNPLLPSDPAVVGRPAAEAEIRDLLSGTGLGVLEIGVFPIRADMDVARLEPVMDFSATIGAKYIVCPVEDGEETRRAETFSRVCELARAAGLAALVEFNPYSACPNLAGALDLVASARQPNGGLCIDAFHLSRSGGHPDDLRGLEPSLLPIVHFCDARPLPAAQRSVDEVRRESRTARLLPGDGVLPLSELLRALPEDVAISVEAPTAANVHLPPAERARLALTATRRVLDGTRADGR